MATASEGGVFPRTKQKLPELSKLYEWPDSLGLFPPSNWFPALSTEIYFHPLVESKNLLLVIGDLLIVNRYLFDDPKLAVLNDK